MKKSVILIFTVITTLCLAALGYANWSDSEAQQAEINIDESIENLKYFEYQNQQGSNFEFYYGVAPRFLATITKDKLLQSKTLVDLVPKGATTGIDSFRDVNIGFVPRDNNKLATGDNGRLNQKQLTLLLQADYSTNFYVEAFAKSENSYNNAIRDEPFVYYITVVPEKQAQFKNGHSALLAYLKAYSKESIGYYTKDQLKPGKIYFVVSKKGEITHVELDSSSGISSVDETMIKLISTMPGEWFPATNSNGKEVEQQLVFSFGLQGC